MTEHLHSALVEGCYRCELSRDEAEAAAMEVRIEARALRDAAVEWDQTEATPGNHTAAWLRARANELESA